MKKWVNINLDLGTIIQAAILIFGLIKAKDSEAIKRLGEALVQLSNAIPPVIENLEEISSIEISDLESLIEE